MKICITKILCPVDFSDCSDHAMQYALALSEAYEAELQLLHVVEPPTAAYDGVIQAPVLSVETLEQFQATCREHLQAVAEEASKQYHNVTYHVASGVPWLAIVQAAKSAEIDLIVAGTHGRSGLAHALIGSVAEKLVRKAPCPVLTVKHPEHEFVMP